MASLSAQDILRIWEAGTAEDPLGRALTILTQASPGTSRESLAALPVGRRDARLIAIREETFGSLLEGDGACPRCAERVEFRLPVPEMRAQLGPGDEAVEGEMSFAEWSVRYRLPTSDDLAYAAAGRSPEEARLR